MLACSRVTIVSKAPVPAQLDGDAFGTTPLEIEADAGELTLIAPDRAAQAPRTQAP
jgi:diacylglycerol kinase family enzyme